MKFSDNAMCAILLCSYIGIENDDILKPLTLKEWNELLDRVAGQGQQPGVVMEQNQGFLRENGYSQEYMERIKRLLSRGGTVAFKLNDLEGKGIDIVTQFDGDYPVLMKRRLKKKTPPLLFYSGDIGLAKKIGIGVAGSRNVDEAGIRFTQRLVEKAAAERLVVYSGGAKGVDAAAERAAVESGSAAVSFVAESMISKINKKDILDAIISKKCLLLSDVKPEAGFSAARAMNRNKYIYTSSYGTFVVASDYNKGGTWTGATEAMKNEWTKVLVWNHREYEGNARLMEKGAIPYELSEAPLLELLTKKEEEFRQVDLFSFSREMAERKGEEGRRETARARAEEDSKEIMGAVAEEGRQETVGAVAEEGGKETAESKAQEDCQAAQGLDMYHIIAPYVLEHIGKGMTGDQASEAFHVAKGQMNTWLKRLCQESRLKCVKGFYVKQ